MADSEVLEDKYRSYMYGESEKNTVWKDGAPPNYDLVNKLFEQGRTHEWPVGSLEEKVQRLVKTWEMELVHKVRPEDWKTVNPTKFRFSVNGRESITAKQIGEMGGSYNVFLQTDLPHELRIFDPSQESTESSQSTFTNAFPRGFAIEILEVYSGPPAISYKFRHWGYMDGPFKGHAPTGELLELFGTSIFHVDEDMKVVKVEFFYERGDFLSGFLKGVKMDSASSCPVMAK